METHYGKEVAGEFDRFETAYRLIKSDRGCFIDGSTPDGRTTGTCDRCGTAIMNVFVFASSKRLGFMHVGIDCASQMGIPYAELKKARGYWRQRERDAETALRRAAAAERDAARKALEEARFAANSAVVEELEQLLNNPAASSFERDVLGRFINYARHDDLSFLQDEDKVGTNQQERDSDMLQSIRDRLNLCASSKGTAHTVGERLKEVTLRAYRKPVTFDNAYGTVRISFLTDGVTAYTHKSTNNTAIQLGEVCTASWTVKGTNTRDGLTSIELQRPAKLRIQEPLEASSEE